MRATVAIALIILALPASGQYPDKTVYTLDRALKAADKNNPSLINDSIRKKVRYEIKSAWYSWIYTIEKYSVLQEYGQSLSDLERIAALRYRSGDAGYYETSSLFGTMAEIKTNVSVLENEILLYENKLRQLLYVSDGLLPADSAIYLYEIDKSFAFDADPFAGDSVTREYREFVHDLSVENRQIELDNLFIRLQYYYSFGLDHAQAIQSIASARLKSEDIDYVEYARFISESYKISMDYLDLLNQYNQSAIQLEHDAY